MRHCQKLGIPGNASYRRSGNVLKKHTVFVLDTSATMAVTDYRPTRLTCSIRMVAGYIRSRIKASPHDLVTIVAAGRRNTVLASELPVTDETLFALLANLSAAGKNDLSEAIVLGLEVGIDKSEYEQHILCITDLHDIDERQFTKLLDEYDSNIRMDIVELSKELQFMKKQTLQHCNFAHRAKSESELLTLLEMFATK